MDPCNDCGHPGEPEGSWVNEEDSTLHIHWDEVLRVDGITAVVLDGTSISTMVVQLKGDRGDTPTWRTFTFTPEGLMHTISVLTDVAREAGWTWVIDQLEAHLKETKPEWERKSGPWPIP